MSKSTERISILRQSLPGNESLNFSQRKELERHIKDWFGSSEVQVDDVNGDFEMSLRPSVRRDELEELVGKFVAGRENIHRRSELVVLDR